MTDQTPGYTFEGQIFPFGERLLASRSGTASTSEGPVGLMEIYGLTDQIVDDTSLSPEEALDSISKLKGPRVCLAFTTSQSARDFAQSIIEVADEIDDREAHPEKYEDG